MTEPDPARGDSPADLHALPPGTRIAEFEIERTIGHGGFSIVYLAFDHSLHRRVALKEYLPAAFAHRGATLTIVPHSEHHRETFQMGLKSFVQEARLLAQFDHPALVKVHRFWEANGTAYMAMAYYEGPTLRERYAGGRRPSQRELVDLVVPLLDAVEILHRKQCFHRDIAPDNVIMQADGRPVLLDFGAARRIIGEATQALTVVLKAGYAPVEQYSDDGAQAQGPWTDVYAFAALLYGLVTGKGPQPSVSRALSDTLAPLSASGVEGYDERFLRGIDAGLALKPRDRPQSIAEFREKLGLSQTEAAPPPQPPPAAAVPPTGPPNDDEVERTLVFEPTSPSTATRTRRWPIVAAIGGAAAILAAVAYVAMRPAPPVPAPVARGESDRAPSSPPPAVTTSPLPDVAATAPAAPAATLPPQQPVQQPAVAPLADGKPSAPQPPVAPRAAPPAPAAPKPDPGPTDAKAQYEIARDLQAGRTSPKDDARAAAWLRRSADQGHAPAQRALGDAYAQGLGVRKDDAAALGWYLRAAEQGDAEAQVAVAHRYRAGLGVEKDLPAAILWYRQAASRGNATAKEWLARLAPEQPAAKTAARQDAPSAKSEPKAKGDVAQAPPREPPPAAAPAKAETTAPAEPAKPPVAAARAAPTTAAEQYELGRDYEEGRNGLTVDLAEAAKWYRRAAEQGDARAQNSLGFALLNGRGVKVDYAEARRWFDRSAASGNAAAENNIGGMYWRGQGVVANDVLAAQWFRKSAEHGYGWGQVNLGRMYENGRGVFRDPKAAADWYRKAADGGHGAAMYHLALLYEAGNGVPKDRAEAIRWARASAQRGNKDGAALLAKIERGG